MNYFVEALDTYEKNNITDKGLGYVPRTGERFSVSKERLDVLLGNNDHNKVFVKLVEQPKEEPKPAEIKKTVKKKKTK